MIRSGAARAGLGLKPGQRLALNASLRQSMTVLAMRGPAIKRMARSLADENPFLEVTLPGPMPVSRAGEGEAPDFDGIGHDEIHPVSLGRHIIGEIEDLVRDPDLRAVALMLAEHVSPAGWLDPEGIERAAEMGVEGEVFEALLGTIQSMDPPGLFARNLAECLRIQLERMGEADADAGKVLAELGRMSEGGAGALAGATGLPPERVEAVLRRFRRCNPKPGSAFIQDEGEIFRPDLIIEAGGEGFTVAVNRDSLPEISVVGTGAEDEADRLLLDRARAEARMLRTAIRQRSEMLLAAGGLLVRHQAGFLRDGEKSIRPLTMQDLADRLGCHKGTVSRLVAGKLCQTHRGMMAMREFFATGLRQPDGGIVSGRAVAARIVEAVASEDPEVPHSDEALAGLLAGQGFAVARRTVAKYRHANSIPPWRQRKAAPPVLEGAA